MVGAVANLIKAFETDTGAMCKYYRPCISTYYYRLPSDLASSDSRYFRSPTLSYATFEPSVASEVMRSDRKFMIFFWYKFILAPK